MLGTPEGATVAWVHFLAFDLFVGRWVYLDARARGVSPWATSPLLFATLMVGPVGLLGYLAVRGWVGRERWGPRRGGVTGGRVGDQVRRSREPRRRARRCTASPS